MGKTADSESVFGYAEVTLDKAGRFLIPAEFYEQMKGRAPMRMTVDLQGRCLEVRTEEAFAGLVERIKSAARRLSPEAVSALMIEYLGFSVQVQVDNAYRLTIPKKMRETLDNGAELVLVGVGESLQIWSRASFKNSQKARREVLVKEMSKVVNAVYGLGDGNGEEDSASDREADA